MSFARVYRVGVWFAFVRSAVLLAVVLCWVDYGLSSWVLLCLLCFLCVTHPLLIPVTELTGESCTLYTSTPSGKGYHLHRCRGAVADVRLGRA